MEPGAAKLPFWVQAVAPLALFAIIVLGGLWLQRMEKKARAIEKQQLLARAEKEEDA